MAATSLTPEEFELHLKDLRDRLQAYLQRGEGSLGELRKLAEQVLELAPQFPQIRDRYPDVEGMVAEMLAREKQQQHMAIGAPQEAPGCLLGWLFGRKKRSGERRS